MRGTAEGRGRTRVKILGSRQSFLSVGKGGGDKEFGFLCGDKGAGAKAKCLGGGPAVTVLSNRGREGRAQNKKTKGTR